MFVRMGVYLVKFERYYHTLRKAQTSIDVTALSCKLPSVQHMRCIVTLTDTFCRQKALDLHYSYTIDICRRRSRHERRQGVHWGELTDPLNLKMMS